MKPIIINELSLAEKDSLPAAKSMMETWVKTTSYAARKGFSNFKSTETFVGQLYATAIGPDYLVSQWINDKDVDHVVRAKFRRIAYKSPLIPIEKEEALENQSRSSFYVKHDGQEAQGLGAAWLLETASLSLNSSSLWQNSHIELNHEYLHDSGDIQQSMVLVHNFASPEQFDQHLPWLINTFQKSIENGKEFWARRQTLFPNLIFCGDTEAQIKNLGSSKTLELLKDKFSILNQALEDNPQPTFDYQWVNSYYALRISPESNTTMKKYGHRRQFHLPQGGKSTFELHLKFGPIRVHILSEGPSTILVGYIGPHLPTKKFN